MQRSKSALVLAGGGVAGAAYEIGALCAIDQILEQHSVNEFDSYVGTSAGALVGSCLANNISPRTLLSVLDSPAFGIDQLEPQHLFSLNLPAALARIRHLPAALGTITRNLLTGQGVSLFDLAERLAPSLPSGLYDANALEGYLRAALELPGRTNRFSRLNHELAIIATDLDTGERAIFGHPPLEDVAISQAVSASAAIPFFYRPVRIDDRDYIDGGIRGTVSLDVAIEGGAELIVCINPMVPFDNSHHLPGHAISDEGVPQIGSQVFRTFIHAGLHYHIKQIRRRHPEVDIILIEPSRDDHVMFHDSTMRYQTRLTIARHAFETVATQLTQHFSRYSELLGRHGIMISDRQLCQDLIDLKDLGDDFGAMRSIMMGDGALSRTPAGLAHTLAELDRLLGRIEGSGA
ncbi:patatin-like phospholipase family protein [Oscillochloris sp. ZM17-4]|nr:patatin-like phospholipase family protein [Oscillochloris sp. ZM17-4]